MKTIYIVFNLLEQPVMAFYSEAAAQKYIDDKMDFKSSCVIIPIDLI